MAGTDQYGGMGRSICGGRPKRFWLHLRRMERWRRTRGEARGNLFPRSFEWKSKCPIQNSLDFLVLNLKEGQGRLFQPGKGS